MAKKKKTEKKLKPGVAVKTVTKDHITRALATLANAANTMLDTLYILDESNNKITLSIEVGAKEQTSDMTVKLDDSVIIENHDGNLNETSLGTNKALNGQKLSITATIADTSKETNLTTLTIHLKGGFIDADFPLSKIVDEEGASADYLCLIEFFRP